MTTPLVAQEGKGIPSIASNGAAGNPAVIVVLKELVPGEDRVATVPEVVRKLTKSGHEVRVEHDAGMKAFYPDDLYLAAGAKIASGHKDLLNSARVVLRVQPPTIAEIDQLDEGTIVIGFMNATNNLDMVARMRDRKITAFALELVPRITRAQSMDALSSQATADGYTAAILGANNCPKFLPMLDDYLVKPFSLAELVARVQSHLRRGASIPTTELRAADLVVDLLKHKVSRAGKQIDLSNKEVALLEYLLRNQDQIVTRQMIVENVWDSSFKNFTNVVDVYINYLRNKIDRDFEPRLIQTVRGVGYKLAC